MSDEVDEPQDDAYASRPSRSSSRDEARRSLVRRAVTMTVITAIALPAAWSYDHRGDGAEQQLAAPPTTVATPVGSVTTVVVALVPPPEPITTATAASTATAATADLPEIETAEDLARVTGRPLPEASDRELPEITAPARPSGRDDDDAEDADGSGSEPEAAATTAAGTPAASPAPAPDARNEPAPPSDPPTTPAPPPPDTTAAAAPAPASTEEEVRQLIRTTFPSDQHETALKVASRESSFDPGAVSPSGCCLGIFQIHYTANQDLVNGLGYDREDLFDPAANVAVAYALWQRSGWRPWSQTAY